MSQLNALGGQKIGLSGRVLPMNIQGCFSLGLTDLISLQSKGLSRVFSSTVYTLTPVPRLIITPETPEPEARPGGPPSQLEAGSGGFSSASSFDESEDDVVAGGGGASDPEDRSGVSGTHCTLEPDPHRPHSPPPNSPTPAFPLRSSLELHQQFYLQAPLPSTNLFPLTAGFLALQAPSSSFSPFPRLQSWGLKWMAAGQLHGTQEPLKVA